MKNFSIKKLIPWAAAVIAAVCLIAVSCLIVNGRPHEKTGHTIVFFGDSILAYKQDETSVANRVAAATGIDVLDLSFGGTQMSLNSECETLGNKRNYLSMFLIAQALYTDDFSLQRNYYTYDPATEYFQERIEALQNLDLKNTDIVIIEHCLNDYHSNVPITSEDDSEYSYEGAFRAVIGYLRSVNPDLRIIILSPTKKWIDEETEAGSVDYGNGTLDMYLDAQRRLAEELGVEYLSLQDVYDQDYALLEGSVTGFGFTVDGTHPNAYGRDVISRRIIEYLEESEK